MLPENAIYYVKADLTIKNTKIRQRDYAPDFVPFSVGFPGFLALPGFLQQLTTLATH